MESTTNERIDGLITLMNAQFKNVNGNLEDIKTHLKTLNGKVAEHDRAINVNLPHSIKDCAQSDTIQEIRDNMVSSKAIKRAIVLTISLTGGVLGAIWVIVRLVEPLISKL